MAAVVHFEIGTPDAQAGAAFYSGVFDWQIPGVGASLHIEAGLEGGPSGRIACLGHEPDHYVLIYVEVDDIEAALVRVAQGGGARVVGPAQIPDGRKFAWFRDPFGNLIGLITRAA